VNRQKKEIEKKRQMELLAITPIDSFRMNFRFLSNFFPVKVTFEGLEFLSTEAAYQAAKTLDPEVRKLFVSLGPSEAKALGNNPEVVKLREDWEEVKDPIMFDLLTQKFSQSTFWHLIQRTGTRSLIEGNSWHDVYWGVCNGKCKYGPHPPYGENRLGEFLMEIRCGNFR
jgi:ribA/ribD-fused uncharacterized protein